MVHRFYLNLVVVIPHKEVPELIIDKAADFISEIIK